MGRAGPGAVAALLTHRPGVPCAIPPVPPPLLTGSSPPAWSWSAASLLGSTLDTLGRRSTPRPTPPRYGWVEKSIPITLEPIASSSCEGATPCRHTAELSGGSKSVYFRHRYRCHLRRTATRPLLYQPYRVRGRANGLAPRAAPGRRGEFEGVDPLHLRVDSGRRAAE
jgi:hypothetical protein